MDKTAEKHDYVMRLERSAEDGFIYRKALFLTAHLHLKGGLLCRFPLFS